jgi:hypothetical protein
MDVKDKQPAVIEFMLLEGCNGEEIAIHLRNVHIPAGYCFVSVFKWISDIRGGNERLRNKCAPESPVDAKLMQ